MNDSKKKTEVMEKYEIETGKKAIWQGKITDGFKRFQKGEKIYEKDKERITILIPEGTKSVWQEFINKNKISTISKLMREAVKFYMKTRPKMDFLENFSKFSHDLKEPLTSIRGFSQILIESYSDRIDIDISLKLKDIYTQSILLEKVINEAFTQIKAEKEQEIYDVLVVDDDPLTITVLEEYFERKGFKCKGIRRGNKLVDELNIQLPKLILLDILLPDITGYELCKKIKSDKKYKHIPIYYITALPESEVKQKMEETGVDGLFIKPFNLSEFEIIYNHLL